MKDKVYLLQKIKNNPEKAAELANLIYVSDKDLTIKRCRAGKGFYYTYQDKKIDDKKQINRIKSLVIPPIWNNVSITHLENGHLQVVGRDLKKRKQYRYHPNWNAIRNKTKFYNMLLFVKKLPKIRKKIDSHLSLKGMPKEKCLALIVKLMEETHIRIGNEYYAKKNKTYGLSTMRTRHIELNGTKMRFHFKGKRGKEHNITLKSKKLTNLVLKTKEIPGWELFKYYDNYGNHHSIDSGMVNDYIRNISEVDFTAKDFRTWAGSKIFFETLYDLGFESDEKINSKNILQAFDMAATGLGNTRNVCRKYYVHPYIETLYKDGSIKKYFSLLDTEKEGDYLSASEKILTKLLESYKIDFL